MLRYIAILGFAISVLLFTQCKSDNSSKDKAAPQQETVVDDNVARDTFYYLATPKMTGWNLISQTLNMRNVTTPGYSILDTLSYTHYTGKSYLSYMYGKKLNPELNLDYKLVFNHMKGQLASKEQSFNEYKINGQPMYEMRFQGDPVSFYKLMVPRGEEIIQLEIMTHGEYSDELKDAIAEIPGLIRIVD